MRSISTRLPHAAWRARTSMVTFRRVQAVRPHCHIAPAGPACLNNNAPFRRGRPNPFARESRACLSAPDVFPEAIRS